MLDFYEVLGTGLSTLDAHYGEEYVQSGRLVKKRQIEVDTLENICVKYADEIIDFMKIDVEGFELQVLSGANFNKYRPKILVIESTEPNSQTSTHLAWEKVLISNRYSHCFSDGLNRYYLASECEELRKHFSYPPNVFDNFITAREFMYQNKLYETEQNLAGAMKLHAQLNHRIFALLAELDENSKSNYWILKRIYLKLRKYLQMP